MQSRSLFTLGALCAALALAGCGGGGDGGSTGGGGNNGGGDGGGTTPTPTNKFTQSGEWKFTLPAAGASVCYDFDTKTAVASCSGNTWDLKLTSSGLTGTLWTNSGTSGTGSGGAFGGPFEHTWDELKTYQNATTDPTSGAALPATVYAADAAASVFTGTNDIRAAAFEYGVTGSTTDHSLYPNFRVFLITANSAAVVGSTTTPVTTGDGVFALQVTGYYGGPGGTTSGHISFRWVTRTTAPVIQTATVDATSGWVYYDLVNKRTVDQSGTWHIAFNRYNVKLNGGSSGTGTIAGFLGKTPAGFYDTTGKPIAAKFTSTTSTSDTEAELTATDLATPARTSAWVKDSNSSALNPAVQGAYPNPLSYGWYTYYPTAAAAKNAGLPEVAHIISANPANGTLIRNGEGSSYTRLHLTGITYADPQDANSAQTWTFAYDLQPAAD